MAVVKYGLIITDIKGKVGGQVLQGGNGTPVLRNNSRGRKAPTATRQAATNALQSITTLWRTLSDADRAAWADIRPDWLFINKYGSAYEGSAFQVFTAYNRNLLTMEEPTIDVPDAITAGQEIGTVTFSASTAGALPVGWDNALDGDNAVLVFASPMYSAGKGINNIRFAFMKYTKAASDTEVNIGAEYIAMFGTPRAGMRIFVKVIVRNLHWSKDYYVTQISAIVS